MINNIKKSTYIFNADLIRAIAILGVIGIHVINPIYSRPDFFNGSLWWVLYSFDVLFRTSVPMFVILSGYLVLGKEVSVKDNLIRIKNRILIPLISFYTILHVYSYFSNKARIEPYNFMEFFINLSKNTDSHLYFLVILAFLYLLIPLFQSLFKTENKTKIKYIINFFFINAMIGTFVRYLSLREGDIFNTFTFWTVWIGYFLFGQWYRKYGIKINKKILLSIFSLGYAFTYILGYLSLYWHYKGNNTFYIDGKTYFEEYLSVGVVIMSLSLFLMIIESKQYKLFKNKIFTKIIKRLAVLSYGIYLIHPIIMDYLNKFRGINPDSPSMPNLWIYVAINTTLTFLISFIFVNVISKIPFIKKIIGTKN